MSSQRRSAVAMILGSAAMAAILLASPHAAQAESVFDIYNVHHQAFALIGWSGGNTEQVTSEMTPTASATLGTESGIAYADAYSSYYFGPNNATLTIEGHITAHGGPSGGGGYGYGGGSTNIGAAQNISRPTRLHIVGTMTRSINVGPNGHPEVPTFTIASLGGGPMYSQAILSDTGTINFIDTVDIGSSSFSFGVYELYTSAFANYPPPVGPGYGSGSNSYSITMTMSDVPEPSTLVLLGAAALALLAYAWRRHSRA